MLHSVVKLVESLDYHGFYSHSIKNKLLKNETVLHDDYSVSSLIYNVCNIFMLKRSEIDYKNIRIVMHPAFLGSICRSADVRLSADGLHSINDILIETSTDISVQDIYAVEYRSVDVHSWEKNKSATDYYFSIGDVCVMRCENWDVSEPARWHGETANTDISKADTVVIEGMPDFY
jgi:hypothetical protein